MCFFFVSDFIGCTGWHNVHLLEWLYTSSNQNDWNKIIFLYNIKYVWFSYEYYKYMLHVI